MQSQYVILWNIFVTNGSASSVGFVLH
uniref:Uncharacterized protein n=1 Tax=Anguilla anguilla TaxID=7936 RepID=A0A0E9PLE1_ANGAN